MKKENSMALIAKSLNVENNYTEVVKAINDLVRDSFRHLRFLKLQFEDDIIEESGDIYYFEYEPYFNISIITMELINMGEVKVNSQIEFNEDEEEFYLTIQLKEDIVSSLTNVNRHSKDIVDLHPTSLWYEGEEDVDGKEILECLIGKLSYVEVGDK
jgi:hypothetical protein